MIKITFSKIITLFNILSSNLVYIIGFLFPKDKKLLLFGADSGQSFSDNSKYLFEYVIKNHPELRPVWVIPETKKLLKK